MCIMGNEVSQALPYPTLKPWHSTLAHHTLGVMVSGGDACAHRYASITNGLDVQPVALAFDAARKANVLILLALAEGLERAPAAVHLPACAMCSSARFHRRLTDCALDAHAMSGSQQHDISAVMQLPHTTHVFVTAAHYTAAPLHAPSYPG